MLTPNLLVFQRETYHLVHARRVNLALHACAQPLFVLGLAAAVVGAFGGGAHVVGGGIVAAAVAAAAQGIGHKLELTPPGPFRSKLDLVVRFVAEQFVTFPSFVLSGEFRRAWNAASERRRGSKARTEETAGAPPASGPAANAIS